MLSLTEKMERKNTVLERLREFSQLADASHSELKVPSMQVLQNEGGRDDAPRYSRDYADFVGVPELYAFLHDEFYFYMTESARQVFVIEWINKISVDFDFSGIEMSYYMWLLNNRFCGVVSFLQTAEEKLFLQRINELHSLEVKQVENFNARWLLLVEELEHFSEHSTTSNFAFLLAQACTKIMDVDIYTIIQMQSALISYKSQQILHDWGVARPIEPYEKYYSFCDDFDKNHKGNYDKNASLRPVNLMILFKDSQPEQWVKIDEYHKNIEKSQEKVAFACVDFFYDSYQNGIAVSI